MTRTEIPRSPRRSAERSQPFRRSGAAHPVTLDQTPGGKFHCLGAHLSVAGGMHHAIEQALRLRCATVQVFVKNQRQWRAAPLRSDDLQRWYELLATPEFGPTVAHATYLINLAATSTELYEQSQAAFAEELLRCDALGIPYLVIHPGTAGAQPVQL